MLRRLYHFIPLVALAALFSGVAVPAGAGVFPGWSYRAWQTDEGLPDNSVTGVVQTGDGYLWVATYAGLLRFNGADFQAIPQTNVFQKPVRTLLADRRGRFWLGIDSGAVVSLEAGGVRVYDGAAGMPSDRIAVLAEDGAGAVWAAYPSELCRIQDGQVTVLAAAAGWPAGQNAWVTADARGELWYSKGGTVGVFRDGRLQQKLSFSEPAIRIYGPPAGGLWICTGSHLLRYMEGREPEERVVLPGNVEPQVLFEDHGGALWIGTTADGLFRFKDGELEKVPTSHESVYCLSEDAEGNLWAGTRGGGLNLIRPSAVALIGREAGLPFEAVASVCEDTEGVMWVAALSGVLANDAGGKWRTVGAEAGWTGESATAVAADRAGGVWVGSRNRTLHHFAGGVWREWRQAEGLHSGAVHLIFVTRSNDVWVVTGSPSKLQRLRAGQLAPPVVLPENSRTIRAMAEGTDGTIWIGTLEGQILRLNGAGLAAETVAAEPSGAPVRALAVTGDGTVWAGYGGAGVGRLKEGKLARVTGAAGLADDFASQLLGDGRGGMWVVGNRGLFEVGEGELAAVAVGKAERLRSLVFGRNEGLPNFQPNSANFPNVCRARDGRLWFALRSGLLTVRPEKIQDNLRPPPVVVERVSVDDEAVALYDSRSAWCVAGAGRAADLRSARVRLRVPPGFRKVEVDFAALSFASPENVHFRYRLENYDGQWIEAGGQRRATYPHLGAGDYAFQVIACNNAGVWNETGARLLVTVPPFFWQTWWFRGGLLGLFTAGVVAVVRYVSFRRLRRRMGQLEQQAALDRERTRIARDMHDEVGAKLTRLSLLSEMAMVHPGMPAKVRAEVQELSETARETVRSFEEAVWAVNPRNETLTDLIHYLCRYAEDYLEGSPVACAFELPPQIPAAGLPPEVRRQVFLAAKEALNNAVKHAGAQRLRVALTLGAGEFVITIEDDGCGFDPGSPPVRPGGGNGLENMRERLRSIGGRTELHSEPGVGTRVEFHAPLPGG